MSTKLIYHITTKALWQEALQANAYSCPSIAAEGFIHCCESNQIAGVLERYYKGQQNLLQLSIDQSLITNELKYELAPSINENFPHIYGTLNLNAVIFVDEIINT